VILAHLGIADAAERKLRDHGTDRAVVDRRVADSVASRIRSATPISSANT
jgi:hypothetical protein